MRCVPLIAGLAVTLLAAAGAAEELETSTSASAPGGFGLGLAVGHPSAVVIKKNLSGPNLALQAGLGTGIVNGHGLHLHADVVWSPVVLADTNNHRVPFYLGGGLRYYDHYYDRVSRFEEGRDTHVGLRLPLGVVIEFKSSPFDVFVETAVVADLVQTGGCNLNNATQRLCAHDERLGLHVSLGARYYFGR